MDRFTAYLLLRRFLLRRESRNRALLVEAIMEELAAELQPTIESTTESWGVLGMLSQLDLEYAEHNPKTRGTTAREQALLEGMNPALAESLVRWCDDAAEGSLVEEALRLADHLAGALLAALEQQRDHCPSPSSARPFQDMAPLGPFLEPCLARDLTLQRQAGDSDGARLDGSLSHLRLDELRAANLAARALGRVAQDLR